MLKWNKQGQIFDPSLTQPFEWMTEYAQLPSPLVVDENTVRVYFACRPARDGNLQYVSRSGYVELDLQDLSQVKYISEKPLFELGNAGAFDEFGSMTSSFVRHEDKVYGYYTGWTRLQSVPYTMAVGMGISEDGGRTFTKLGQGPILAPTPNEPYLVSGPVVKKVKNNWHMWYLFGTKWIEHNGKKEPIYKLAHATSLDGINWQRDGKQVIPSKYEDECQVSFGIFEFNGSWHTIFAYRQPTDFRENTSRSYRLGYAKSDDLITWHRDDELIGINVSGSGWDSEMICYPQVCQIGEDIVMFYCGNNFGQNGFGYAKLDISASS
ncbi:hypothetical protein [Thalassotalea sediminis]|uniref:hypothetical protein n=1 Tax=Thalassotalea sediminis TaxID=1759089 RepID=UPI002572DE39|nr:hypothetical protein [Thalassotalea sediminis]